MSLDIFFWHSAFFLTLTLSLSSPAHLVPCLQGEVGGV